MFDPSIPAVRSALAAVSGSSLGSSRDYESMSDDELEAAVEMGRRRVLLDQSLSRVGGVGLGLTATLGVARMLR